MDSIVKIDLRSLNRVVLDTLMDLSKVLQELYAEKERLEHSIAMLEELQNKAVKESPHPMKHRGRRRMSTEERLVVSNRMRRYWAARRSSSK
jgi:hypothetical protein